jgi:hypothetical protein
MAPKVDSMLIETKGNSFEFYAASSKLEGKLLSSVGYVWFW